MPRAAPTSNYDGRFPEPPYKTADDERDEMIAEAVAEERERCAKIAEGMAEYVSGETHERLCGEIAKQIRGS